MDETARLVEAQGVSFEAVRCDIADSRAAAAMMETLMADQPLDGLVNSAGIIWRADAMDFTEADWDAVMDMNIKSLFFLCQAFGRNVISAERGGRIVNIASLLSLQGGIRVPSYTASKHGVLGITRLLANEWASKRIT